MKFKKEGSLSSKSLGDVFEDFDKIKRAENKNKYLLLFGVTTNPIDAEELDQSFLDGIDNRSFKKYQLKTISVESFKSPVEEKLMLMNMILIKLAM